jgi:hypothetical protein
VSSDGPSPSYPNPNNDDKGKGKGKGKGRARIMALMAPATTTTTIAGAPQRGLLQQSLDRHHLDVARDVSSIAAAGASTTTRHSRCTGILRGSRRFLLRTPAGSSTAPTASHGSCLVALDGHVVSAVIGQPLQHHSLDSLGGH